MLFHVSTLVFVPLGCWFESWCWSCELSEWRDGVCLHFQKRSEAVSGVSRVSGSRRYLPPEKGDRMVRFPASISRLLCRGHAMTYIWYTPLRCHKCLTRRATSFESSKRTDSFILDCVARCPRDHGQTLLTRRNTKTLVKV